MTKALKTAPKGTPVQYLPYPSLVAKYESKLEDKQIEKHNRREAFQDANSKIE